MKEDIEDIKLYADFIIGNDNNDMFVITPENNYFKFSGNEYSESSDDTVIIDPTSHKRYTVVFNE